MHSQFTEREFILFIDSDVVVPPDLLMEVEHLFSSDSRIAFINIPCIVEKNNERWLDKFYRSVIEPMGAAIRSALDKVGSYFIVSQGARILLNVYSV